MHDTIHYLPLFCRQLIAREVPRMHVHRWLLEAQADWRQRQETQQQSHRQWSLQPLRRPELLLRNEALGYASLHARCVDYALAHLGRFAETGHLTEVYRAAARWRRAEQARKDYQAKRALLERTALEWRQEKAA